MIKRSLTTAKLGISSILRLFNLKKEKPEEESRETMYTKAQLIELYSNKTQLQGYSDNYGDHPKKFMAISKGGDYQGGYHCRESMCSIIRKVLNDGSCAFKVGITWTYSDVFLDQALAASNKLHKLEAELGFKLHVLTCMSVNNSPHVVWVFKLDPKWFNSPPVMSFLLSVIRNGFLGTAYNQQETVYTLLKKRPPHEIFGRNKKRNWGIKSGLKSLEINEAFNPRYGMTAFAQDVAAKNEFNLKAKFPNHKIFEENA